MIRKRSSVLAGVTFVAAALLIWATGVAGQANQFKVGLLPFADSTGSSSGDSVSRAVQTEMTRSTHLQATVLPLDPGLQPDNLDADKAVAIGRAHNVDVVVVGTVLGASAEESSGSANGPSIGGFNLGARRTTMKGAVTLQADIYSTASGQKIDSIQQTGNSSQTKIGADAGTTLGGLNTGGSGFDNTALGKAFHSAVSDLVKKINGEQAQMTRYTGGGAPAVSASAAAPSGPAAPAAPASPAAPAQSAAAPATSAPGGQPVLSAVRIDFVPGERTVFYDDFSDMAPDEPPPHWKLRGSPIELRTGGGIRELYFKDNTNITSPPVAVPSNFTFEVEYTGGGEMVWRFLDKSDNQLMFIQIYGDDDGKSATANVNANSEALGSGSIQTDTSPAVEAALWMQQGRVRVYLNGQRIVDVNQVTVPGLTHIVGDIGNSRPVGLRKVRLAESAPDFGTVIASAGKYVTHGILFDTDSDHLKPESAPVIKEVAAALIKNPNLKLEIDGYTDSVGDTAHNLDLSKRRAQAVQAVLVSQFDIDASRLSSNGSGAAKPIASNDTADGRAANRRVEFVKK